jgi:hypothetical protein
MTPARITIRSHGIGDGPETASRRSFCFKRSFGNVRYWHKADIPAAPAFVRYWGKADIVVDRRNVCF